MTPPIVVCTFCRRPQGYTMTDYILSVDPDDRCTPANCPGNQDRVLAIVNEAGHLVAVDDDGLVPDGRHYTEVRSRIPRPDK